MPPHERDLASGRSIQSDDGTIVFYEHFRAPLQSGNYELTVKQAVASSDEKNAFDETFEQHVTFAVQGTRFTLSPEALQSQFPPPDAQGEYSNVLPHVVFHPRTLPWQRSLGNADGELISWLGLLTFDIDDPIPVVQHGTLENLLTLPAGTVSYPNLALEYGESPTDPILYIDVPAALFTAIAPSADDLRWLAHARVISLETAARKSDNADGSIATEFSVVVSNRLPKPGNKTGAFLVSFESMASYLPGGGGLPANTTHVRLALLASWEFGCVPLAQTFREFLVALDRLPGTPQIPYQPSDEQQLPEVGRALSLGYTAFDHYTRQGAQTVSWYRGPLLPFPNPIDVTVPISSTDALTHYDPATGMFDMSLGTAWQLGQLLALADKDFASLLYEWKRMQTKEAVIAFERNFLGRQLGLEADALEAGTPLHLQLMRKAIRPLLQSMLAVSSSGSSGSSEPPSKPLRGTPKNPEEPRGTKQRWTTSASWTNGLRSAMERAGAESSANTTAEQRITEWLSRLRNLHGVPFNILIPDVRMLPQESLRVFRIDENWIDCLIDGAYSIGRSTTGDGTLPMETAMFRRMRMPIRHRAASARSRRIFGAKHARATAESAPVRSGFLVRSGVVAGWPTIEARAYDTSGNEMRAIRLDRPAPDIFFGLFDGDLAQLSLSEPAETLHFGFEPPIEEGAEYRKVLKWVTGSAGHAPGAILQGASVAVPMRDASRRVIDASALANTIHQTLLNAGGIAGGAQYTTAEFALELVQGVQQVDYPVNAAGNEVDA